MAIINPQRPKTVRDRIFRYLRQHPQGSPPKTIASQLFITKGTVLRHLRWLTDQDLVTSFNHPRRGLCYRATASTERSS